MKTEELRELIDEKTLELQELKVQLAYQEQEIPSGCECDIEDWRDEKVNPICPKFEQDEAVGLCKNCEHQEECH